MLADPQSIPFPTAGTKSLARQSVGPGAAAVYSTDDQLQQLQVSHLQTKGGRTRRLVKVTFNKTAADPIIPAQNKQFSMSVSIVFDVPTLYGFTGAEVLDVYKGLVANMAATSDTNVKAVIAGNP